MKNNSEFSIESSSDGNYRYPGSRPFNDTEVDRCLFFGRDKETQLLLHKTLNWGLVVLYARSGSGKTSLINAGLNQEFRDRGYMPVTVRLNNPDVDPMQTFFQRIKDFAEQKELDYEHGEEDSLWQFFRTTYFWKSVDTKFNPVIILDQFEEFFIYYSRDEREPFIKNLAELVNNTVPGKLQASIPPGQKLPYNLDPPGIKIIISIREDFLGRLEEMSKYMPVILKDRVRLMPLTREQARVAIIKPSQVRHEAIQVESFKFADDAVDMMLDFLCKQREREEIKITDEVEPFQLQILCRYMEDKSRVKRKKIESEVTIAKEDLGGEKGMQKILQQFYEDQLKKLDSFSKKKRARKLFEKGLISIDHRRLSLEEGEIIRRYKVSESLLKELINIRLLRSEPRVSSIYYELCHDNMIEPIRKSQKRRTKRKWIELGLLFIFTFILIFGVFRQNINDVISQLNLLIKGKTSIINNLFENAQKLRDEGKNKEAKAIYDKILNIDKRKVKAYLEKGKIFYSEEKYKEVINICKKAIDNEVKHELIYYQLGRAFFKNGQSKEAIESYMKSIKINLDSTLAYEGLGDVYYNQQKFNEAIKKYKKVLRIDEKARYVYKKLSISFIRLGLPENALKTFEDALKINPAYAHIYEDISIALKKRNRIDLVEKIYEIAYRSDSRDPSLYKRLGRNYLVLKKNECSIESFKKAIELDKTYVNLYSDIGNVYINIGNFTAAVDELRKAIEHNPGDANKYNVIGYPLLKLGKYGEAIEGYKKALKISPENITIKMNLLEAYFVAGRFDMALNLANNLLEEKDIPIENILNLKFITISSLLFKKKDIECLIILKEFIKYYKSIKGNYGRTLSYDIIREFIKKDYKLPLKKKLLLIKILDLFESPNERIENSSIIKIEILIQEIFE
jgi:tetratricopeptide (TPR) repeat protein